MDAWQVKVDVLVGLGDKVIAKKDAAQHSLTMAQGARSEVRRVLAKLHAFLPTAAPEDEELAVAEKIRDSHLVFAKMLEDHDVEIMTNISIQAARVTVLTELVDDIATDVNVTMRAIEAKAAYEALPEEERAEAKRPVGAKPTKGKVAKARKARATADAAKG